MPRYEVRCEVEVPEVIGATDQQVEDWACFELHENSMLRDNPLSHVDFEAVPFTVRVKRLR
jgi:hypothetical protein